MDRKLPYLKRGTGDEQISLRPCNAPQVAADDRAADPSVPALAIADGKP